MSVETIRDEFRKKVSRYRSFLRLLNSDDFAIAYGHASVKEQLEMRKTIEHADKNTLHTLIDSQLLRLTPFHQMSTSKLRRIGQNIRIPKYWRKNKSTLIKEIEDVVKRLKEGSI